MKKHNVVILYGGQSGEHDVSLMSAASVEEHLNKDIYNIHLIGITRKGLWFYQKNYQNTNNSLGIIENQNLLVSLTPGKGLSVSGKILDIEFIFPILHGTFGEDGTMQGLLDIVGIPYAGSGLDGSYMAMDKEYAKIIWEREGIPVVPFISVKKYDYVSAPDNIKSIAEKKFSYPLFVKPVKTGSSVGVSRIENSEEFHNGVKNAFRYDHKILIEQAVDAREIECSIIGNDNPEIFSLGEIAPSHEFYDYDAKYLDPEGAKLIIPADINTELSCKIKNIAKKAYLALNIKGFSRVDFFLDKKNGEIMLNEINTIPGFTKISMFPMLCAHDGLEYSDLLDKIFNYGLESHKEAESLNYSHGNSHE